MASALNAKPIGHIDGPGGGQVLVDGKTLYIGHVRYLGESHRDQIAWAQDIRQRAESSVPA
jgi:hypothetical protein